MAAPLLPWLPQQQPHNSRRAVFINNNGQLLYAPCNNTHVSRPIDIYMCVCVSRPVITGWHDHPLDRSLTHSALSSALLLYSSTALLSSMYAHISQKPHGPFSPNFLCTLLGPPLAALQWCVLPVSRMISYLLYRAVKRADVNLS